LTEIVFKNKMRALVASNQMLLRGLKNAE